MAVDGKMKCLITYLLILTTVCLTNCVPIRRRRFFLQRDHVTQGGLFPTPTTYPVPTLPNWFQESPVITVRPNEPRIVLTGSSLLNSVQVQCPVKRSTDFQRVLLDERLMKDLYLELVGHIDTDLMSGDMYEAEANFKHILPIHEQVETNSVGRTFGTNRAALIQDIKRFNDWYNLISKLSLAKNKTESTLSPWKQQQNRADQLSDILRKAGISHKQLKQILQVTNDIEEISQYRYHGNHRIKRTTFEHGTSRVAYCHQRGRSNNTQFLHLCSSCALTTQLPENVYPRYVNEATCDPSDCECFTVSGSSQGRCKPIIRNVKMLKRNRHGCRMVIQSGDKFIVDDWTLYDQPLHVGCECMFIRNSQFKTFIPKS